MKFKLILIATVLLLMESCTNEEKFNSVAWKNWTESESSLGLRWQMHENLLNDYNLKGANQKQILDLLGKPDQKYIGGYHYNLGYTGNGIDTRTMVLKFKDDIVINIDVYRG